MPRRALRFVSEREGSVLVVGRSGARGRALGGSVAQGALNHARVPVLIVP